METIAEGHPEKYCITDDIEFLHLFVVHLGWPESYYDLH